LPFGAARLSTWAGGGVILRGTLGLDSVSGGIAMDQSLPQVPLADRGTSGTTQEARDESPLAVRSAARRIQLGALASDRETLMLGRRAFERGDDEVAREQLERLVAHGARYADVHYMLGMLCERSGDLPGALERLREAVRLNPSYVEALLALASLHERRGEYARSQGYAERASQLCRPTAGGLDPTTRGKLANQQAALADALVQAGEGRAAIEQYRGALERCPTFHDVRHRLGIALREAGLPAQAATEFQRILTAHSGLLDSQVQLGLTWYTMGRTADAVAEWEAVLEKDPSRDEARMYLRLVRGRRRKAAADRPGPPTRPAETKEGDAEISFAAVDSAAPPPETPVAGWKTTDLASKRNP